jgi:hypothetical protein
MIEARNVASYCSWVSATAASSGVAPSQYSPAILIRWHLQGTISRRGLMKQRHHRIITNITNITNITWPGHFHH